MTKQLADMIDEDAEGAIMILDYAVASLREFLGEKPFVNPRTGQTMNPQPMSTDLYKDIARAHTELGELLSTRPATKGGEQ
jgi:hypothetical protein